MQKQFWNFAKKSSYGDKPVIFIIEGSVEFPPVNFCIVLILSGCLR